MSHTPGPWRISTDFNNPANEDKVCSIKGGEDDFFIAEICGDQPNQMADTRLIAAAPDMLEALTECEEYFAQRADADHNGNDYVGNAAMDMLMVVRAALAKATEATNGR